MSGIIQGLDNQGLPRVVEVDAHGRAKTADADLREDVVGLLRAILAELRAHRLGAVATTLIEDVDPDSTL
jgi:hypothetical protein